ncbi:GlxA family transcriptional regulator [Tepidamorphus sp. 3E244]|uniref:GlxA family transcriptional regulator n=1 Tax=Tepidamorphus sp. 3E244 TaxID=3385498 RepID=UPI0038FD3068
MSAVPFRVGFLLVDGFPLLSYAAAIEPLRAANTVSSEKLYDIKNLPMSGARSTSASGTETRAQAHVGETVDFDLLCVIAGELKSFGDRRVTGWLRLLARRGIALAGIAGGAAALAETGLMANRRMTAPVMMLPRLSEQHPHLLLEPVPYVIDRDRMTATGGAASGDMMLALISSHHGAAMADDVRELVLHGATRPAYASAANLEDRAGQGGNSKAVIAAIQTMKNNIAEPLPVEELARLSGISERQLVRLFSQRMGQGPAAYYRDLRLETARSLVEQSSLSLTEIALASGFSNSAHFSKAFSDRFGEAPSRLRKARWKTG